MSGNTNEWIYLGDSWYHIPEWMLKSKSMGNPGEMQASIVSMGKSPNSMVDFPASLV